MHIFLLPLSTIFKYAYSTLTYYFKEYAHNYSCNFEAATHFIFIFQLLKTYKNKLSKHVNHKEKAN